MFTKSLSTFGNSHAIHLTGTQVSDIHEKRVMSIDGNTHLLHADSTPVVIQSDAMVAQSPVTTVPVALLNGGTIDFRINKDVISKIWHAYLKVTLFNNASAANIVPAPFRTMINRMDIFGDQGGDLLFSQTGTEFWLEEAVLSTEEHNAQAAITNTTAAYAVNGTAIANNASITYYLPLISFLSNTNLSLSSLDGDMLIRFNFHPTARTIISGALPDCTGAQLLIRGCYEPRHILEHKNKLYQNVPLTVKYLDNQRHEQTMTLAASSSYTIVLSSIRGLVSYLFVVIRPAALTAANSVSFDANINTVDIQDNSGNSMIGRYARTLTEARNLIYAECFENSFNLNSNFFFLPFSESPASSFKSGANLGYAPFDGFDKLILTTGAGLTPGNFEVCVYAKVYNHCTISQGRILRLN